MSYLLEYEIGRPTTIPNWPTNDLDGLFDALKRWKLEKWLNMEHSKSLEPHSLRGPYRGRAFKYAGKRWSVEHNCMVYLNGEPVYPEHPNAVSYWGNFEGYSFGWTVSTDDPELISKLDSAIKENMERA